MRPVRLLLGLAALLPAAAFAQSAGEVERCFQNPAACSTGGGARRRLLHQARPSRHGLRRRPTIQPC